MAPNNYDDELCEECGEVPYDRTYKKQKLCDICLIQIKSYEEEEKMNAKEDDWD